MAVYVDTARNQFGRMIMCHMLADSIAELHEAARMTGMLRIWYQPVNHPHYDLNLARRAIAVRNGAIEVDRRGIVSIKRRLRADPRFVAEVLEHHRTHGHPVPRFFEQKE